MAGDMLWKQFWRQKIKRDSLLQVIILVCLHREYSLSIIQERFFFGVCVCMVIHM